METREERVTPGEGKSRTARRRRVKKKQKQGGQLTHLSENAEWDESGLAEGQEKERKPKGEAQITVNLKQESELPFQSNTELHVQEMRTTAECTSTSPDGACGSALDSPPVVEPLAPPSQPPSSSGDMFMERFQRILRWELKLTDVEDDLVDGLMNALPTEERPRDLLEMYIEAIRDKPWLTDTLVSISRERLARIETEKREQERQEQQCLRRNRCRSDSEAPSAVVAGPLVVAGLVEESEKEAQNEKKLQEDVETILTVLPNLNRIVVVHVYRGDAKEDVNAALEFFLSKSEEEVKKLTIQAQAEVDKKAREQREEDEVKRRMLDKYEYKVVLPKYKDNGEDFVKPIKPNVFITVDPKLGGGTIKQRYRDGQIVTHRGEKYIVEKKKEEYDGGSRGKVMPKGKRGAGWVQG